MLCKRFERRSCVAWFLKIVSNVNKFKKGADDQTLHDVMKIDYIHIFIHFSKLHTSKPPQISFTSFPTVFLLRNNTLAIFLLSRLLVLIYFISLNLIHSKYQYVKTTSNIICITFSFIFIKKTIQFFFDRNS